MSKSKRTNWWVMPVVFFPVFALAIATRGLVTGVWMDPAWAVRICTMVLVIWAVGLFVFRDRYFARPSDR